MMEQNASGFVAAAQRLGLLQKGEHPGCLALTGGVASDIWLVQAIRPFVMKRALEKLRVTADWRAPVSRNACEVAWLELASAAVPGIAPAVLAHDREAGLFAMEYLPPGQFPVWKYELREGRVRADFAARVGRGLAAVHSFTAGRGESASRFNDDSVFIALRLDPYLRHAGLRHPAVASAMAQLIESTLRHRIALVHGDVSPKNILAGPDGPVFLDAECAWYGDPAFDLAFCLNHLLLKCLWAPAATPALLDSFTALSKAYLQATGFENAGDVEIRAAALLPALLLARIDGKSPVEYVTLHSVKQGVRHFAIPLVLAPAASLDAMKALWAHALPKIMEE